jgi:hypothetical protein
LRLRCPDPLEDAPSCALTLSLPIRTITAFPLFRHLTCAGHILPRRGTRTPRF